MLDLLETLSSMGRADLAFQIINQTTYPGFGYMIANGSTTVSCEIGEGEGEREREEGEGERYLYSSKFEQFCNEF
jgi:Bacterial alpha-L-rhamnosidase 6 hairpin glycosidase domain